jgi:DNA-binding Lrp family transcriptional regulator
LDELDIRIVRELTQGRHVGLAWGEINPSYGRIGKKLGVSRETVRDRVEKMSNSGFLKVFPVQVNPSLLGLGVGCISVDIPQTGRKVELIDELSLLEGMILIATHVGTLIGLSFYYEDERSLQKKISLITRICGATKLKFTVQPIPRPSVELSAKDWQIVAALQRGRMRPSGEIAAELGISAKTLQRRTKRMIEGMAISTMVSSAEGAFKGGVIGNLQVEYTSPRTRPQTEGGLLQQLDRQLIYAGLWTSFSLFTLVLASIPEASEILEAVRGTKGVSHARLDLIEERVELYSTLQELVERKLKGSATTTGSRL